MEEEIIIIEKEEEQEIITIEEDIEYIEPTTQEKTVIPTEEQQIVVPDDGVFALSKVNVKSIPSEYIKPSGTLDINANGEYDVKSYEKANVKVGEVEKGLIINEYDNNGYAIDGSIVGMTEVPAYYCYSSSNGGLFSKITNIKVTGNVNKIGSYAFYYCQKLSTVILPDDITEISNSAFYNNRALTLSKLPNNLKTIGQSAFYNCLVMPLKELPNSITTIGNEAFRACRLIELDKLPDNLTTVADSVFYECYALNLKSLPSKITSIGTQAFRGNAMERLDILSTVLTTIKDYPFYDCNNLKTIIFRTTTPPTITTKTFKYCPIDYSPSSAFIYVPDESIDTYKTATNWSVYASQIKGLSELEA